MSFSLKNRALWGGAVGVALLGLTALAFLWAPPLDLSRFHDRSTIVVDRHGAPLRSYMSQDEKWRLATRIQDVDPLYIAMLLSYEDKRFERHSGVDPRAILRAVGQALVSGRVVSGASTLTMQAARLLDPRPRSLAAKLVQAYHALLLDHRFTKDETLSIYLTLAPFGGPVEGVRAASLKLFGREPQLLTPAEAALLVALPQAPNDRRPDRHPDAARAARARVLDRAEAASVISPADAAAARTAPLPAAYRDLPFAAPHLSDALLAEAGRGGQIETTLDLDLQVKVQARLRAAMADHPAPTTAAAIVIDAGTAEVRALVGGPDYFDGRRSGMIDMSRAVRSPGSALKPFVYGLAFDRLLARPETLISDAPFRRGGYAPENFSGGYAGDVTVADALVRSLNVPAVKVLERIGPTQFDAALTTAGLTLDFNREGGSSGLALALGGVGLDLRDLARAFAVFAGDGRMPDRLVLRPGDRAEWRAFISPEAARDTLAILAEAPPPEGHAALPGGRPTVAYKTGTSYGYRDALAVGAARGHVIAVWVGRPDGAACAGCVGIAAAAPILFDIASLLPDVGAAPPPLARQPVPAHLRHFDRRSEGMASSRRTFEIRFPFDGAELRLGRSGAAPPDRRRREATVSLADQWRGRA